MREDALRVVNVTRCKHVANGLSAFVSDLWFGLRQRRLRGRAGEIHLATVDGEVGTGSE